MSVLPNQTNATPNDAFFWKIGASTITANSFLSDRIFTDSLSTGSLTVGSISTAGSIVVSGDITAQNITATDTLTSYFANFQYAATTQGANIGGLLITSNIAGYNTIFYPLGVISSISTANITLDGNMLDTGGAGLGATLLLNGVPIATTSTSISSLVQWAIYPAVSTIILDNNNITEVNNIQTQTLTSFDTTITNQLTVGQTLFGNQAEFQQVVSDEINALNFVSLTGTISSLTVSTLAANSATFNTTTTTQGFTTTLGATNFTSVTGNISDFAANTVNVGTANINQVNATNETVSGTLTVNEVRGVNGFINAEAANRIRIRVQGSSDVFSSPELDLEAGGGNRGIVKLIANPGYGGVQGEVTVTAKGGTAAGYATGGLLNLTAEKGTAVLGTLNTSRVGIAADSVTSYAGGPTPFAGLLGYNFIYGLLGINLVAGTPPTLPNVGGTIYLYGLNPLGFGSSGGVRVQNGMSIDYITPYPQGFIAPEYDLIIKGNPAGQMVTLSNVRVVSGSNALLTGFQDVNSVNVSATNLNGTNIFGSNITGSNVNALVGNISTLNTQNAQITSLVASTVNGFTIQQLLNPPTQSTFQQLFTSSLQTVNLSSITGNILALNGVSSISGFSIAELVSSVSPPTPAPSTFTQLFTSSLQAVNISSITGDILALNGVSSISGFSIAELVSSVSPPTPAPSTFQQLFTSSLQAQNISTLGFQGLYLAGLSSINGYSIAEFVSSGPALTPVTSTFQQLFTSSLQAVTISTQVLNAGSVLLNGIALSPQTSTFGTLTTNLFQANQISSGLLTASTFNGYTIQQLLNPPLVSSFDTLFASNATIFQLVASTGTVFNSSNIVLNVSSINGFNTSQFLSTSGVQPQVSTFGTLTTNTFQANNISSGLLTASSINGFTIQQLLNQPTVSTFQQLFTSSLQTNNLSSFTANIVSLTGVSTLNGFTIADFVSSVAPQPPIPSTVLQFFTSSLAANVITNYQTSTLNLNAPSVGITTDSLVETAGNFTLNASSNYTLTVANNIGINSSNTLSIYNTNTAPPVGCNDLYILGQGTTTFAGQGTTNLTAGNNILVNAVATTGIQGQTVTLTAGNQLSQQANFVNLVGSNQVLLTSPQLLRASSSNLTVEVPSGQSYIYLNQDQGIATTTNKNYVVSALSNIALSSATVTINGTPYSPGVSSFTTLATNILTNNTSPTLAIKSQTATISTGFGLTIESQEILNYSRSLIDNFALTGIALSTNLLSLDATTTTIGRALNAPQIFTSSINGLPYGASSFTTLATNILTNNTSPTLALKSQTATISTGFGLTIESQEILNYSRSLIDFFAFTGIALSTNLLSLDATTTTIGRALNAPQIFTSSINGLPYAPGGGTTVSTFQQLFTSSIVLNTINGQPYVPGGGGSTVSTFSNLFTSNIYVTASTVTSNLVVFDSIYNPSLGEPLVIQAAESLQLIGQVGLVLGTASNDILLTAGILDPGNQNVTLAYCDLNLSNNSINNVDVLNAGNINTTNTTTTNLFASNAIVSSINGQLYSPGVSTFTDLYTNNLYVAASTITSNMFVENTIYGSNLTVFGKQSLGLLGTLAMTLTTSSNDIVLSAGILHPGNQNVKIAFCDLNLDNNSINNVDVLYAGNINTTNTTTTNLYATTGNISSLTVSTINTYPVHKAFGSAWATTDPGALALLAGIVNYVDIPTRQAFNFVPDTTGNVFSLDPSNYPLNRGIYQLNARCTFSNGDSNLATVSSWIDTVPNVSTTGTAISRCVIQIEPNRLGTTFMTCQSLVDEFISVNCFTTSDNITLYYDAGDGSNTPPSYAMNLTAHQLYQYENPFEVYNWPPNPIPPPP